jgi:hypothetical protein
MGTLYKVAFLTRILVIPNRLPVKVICIEILWLQGGISGPMADCLVVSHTKT